jgi:hypothetical protein
MGGRRYEAKRAARAAKNVKRSKVETASCRKDRNEALYPQYADVQREGAGVHPLLATSLLVSPLPPQACTETAQRTSDGPRNYPLQVEVAEGGIKQQESDFNAEFMVRLVPKLDWKALKKAAAELGVAELPDAAPAGYESDEVSVTQRALAPPRARTQPPPPPAGLPQEPARPRHGRARDGGRAHLPQLRAAVPHQEQHPEHAAAGG